MREFRDISRKHSIDRCVFLLRDTDASDRVVRWQVYLRERNDEGLEITGQRRFESQSVAQRYAKELMRLFDVVEFHHES